MLNPFPDLLTYGLLAPFILRLALAFFLISSNYATAVQKTMDLTQAKAIAYVVTGAMIFFGFFTQIAVLVALLIVAFDIWNGLSKKIIYADSEKWCFVFVIVIGLSLMFSSAGAFAIDLPL